MLAVGLPMQRAVLAATAALLLLIGWPRAADATIPSGNLVVNGGAEVGPSSEVGERHPISGWTTTGGPNGFMTVDYRASGDPSLRMHVDDPSTPGCRAFFGGGEGVTTPTSATQDIDVLMAATEIDTLPVKANIAASIGQVGGGEDSIEARFAMLSGGGTQLGLSTASTATSFSGYATFSFTNVSVPVGTRTIRIELKTTPAGPANTTYADGIGVTLDGSTPGEAPPGCNGGTALTGPASGITATTATLAGTVTPNLDLTRYRFEYGPTTAYESSSAGSETGGAPSSVPVSSTITGLTPGTLYHFRLRAESPIAGSSGSLLYATPSLGADGTFRTTERTPAVLAGNVTRSLSIRYAARHKSFRGKIRSSDPACRRDKVKVLRLRKGRDPKVASDQAAADGSWSASADAGPGRYYAKVAGNSRGGVTCPASRSSVVKVGLTRSPARSHP